MSALPGIRQQLRPQTRAFGQGNMRELVANKMQAIKTRRGGGLFSRVREAIGSEAGQAVGSAVVGAIAEQFAPPAPPPPPAPSGFEVALPYIAAGGAVLLIVHLASRK